jgi:hypothetical protein
VLKTKTLSSLMLSTCERYRKWKMGNESSLLLLGCAIDNVTFFACFRRWLFGTQPRRQMMRNGLRSLHVPRILKIVASRTCALSCPPNANGYSSGYTQKQCQFC